MNSIEVTPRVWQRLLEVRAGTSCLCCGDWSAEEQMALDLYGPIASREFTSSAVGQIGQSLDGRISTVSGDSGEVSSSDGLAHLHRLRALVDGVVIGVNTAIHDSPRLTVRLCEGDNPARVVIDPRGRLPNDSLVLEENGARRVVIQAVETERPEGVEVVNLATENGQFHPAEILRALSSIGLNQLLIEGGSFTLAKFIDHDLLHRLHIAVSPLIIGSGQQGLTLFGQSEKLSNSLRPTTHPFALGSEVVFDCELAQNQSSRLEVINHRAQMSS